MTTRRKQTQSKKFSRHVSFEDDNYTAKVKDKSDVGSSQWSLVNGDTLPNYLHSNEFLVKYHRPELNSFVECFKSVFIMHTETWNIWTHFIACMACLVQAIYFLVQPDYDWLQKLTFSSFFAGAIFCLGTSAVYHALLCHSEPVYMFWARMDYCAVVTLIVSSFPPWLHYSFYCRTFPKMIYLVAILLLGGLCIYVVLQERFRKPTHVSLRAGLFSALGLTGVVPGVHYMLSEGNVDTHFLWLVVMAILYLLGGTIYALRIPERYYPGTFDIWCQSHQILHLCVIGGVITCYRGMDSLATYRITEMQTCFNHTL